MSGTVKNDRRQQGSESNVPFIVVGFGTTPFIGVTMVMVSLQFASSLKVTLVYSMFHATGP